MRTTANGRRLVFFLQGQQVPAARVRGYAVAARLAPLGIACDLRAPYPSVYGDTRLRLPWNWLRHPFRPLAVAARVAQLRDLRADDVVFLQRPMIEYPTVALERFAARGRRVVFDFDDAIFVDLGGAAKLRALVDLADQVIAGNGYLARVAGAAHKTTVIPTVIDGERFRPQPPRAARGRDVVIGWTGLRGNYSQLAIAREGIARALRRTGARLLLISNAPPPSIFDELQPTYVPWRAASEVEDLSRIDIGLMPLPDSVFTRGKCGFKLIQYMALARPGIASPVGVNSDVVTHGVDGLLAMTDDEWEEALVQLIEDPQLRARMGAAARARVEAAYTIQAVLPRYLEVLARLGLHPTGTPAQDPATNDLLDQSAAGAI